MKPSAWQGAHAFCNKTCYGRWKAADPDRYKCWTAARDTVDSRERQKQALRSAYKSGRCIHPWIGRKHSDTSKKKMAVRHREAYAAGRTSSMKGRKHTREARELMSLVRTQGILDGRIKPTHTGHRRGHHMSRKMHLEIPFRSSWEEAFMKWLDSADYVSSYAYEAVTVVYELNGARRRYTPDFLVEMTDGTRCLIELKPIQFVAAAQSLAKFAAVTDALPALNVSAFYVYTRIELEFLGVI